MEDSLEDYIRLSKNSQKPSSKNEQEKIKKTVMTLQKKKEAEAKALKIVEFMIEGRLREETFFHCLLHLNPEYYQDVVEERALTKICGYALCSQKLIDMPKQQYHISLKAKKVYDITERKYFCSNYCYEASLHIKQQIETSPLWLRTNDKIPKFSVLPSTSRGLPGEEIDQGIAKPDDEVKFTPVHSFTVASLNELAQNENRTIETSEIKPKMTTINELEEKMKQENETEISHETKDEIVAKQKGKEEIVEKKSLNSEIKEKESSNNRGSLFAARRQIKKSSVKTGNNIQQNINHIFEFMRKCLDDWATIETILFLHGHEKLSILIKNYNLVELSDSLKLSEDKTKQQMKYQEICRKLNLKELEDEKYNHSVVGKELKPVPDYNKLKLESEKMELKIKSFYQGTHYEIDSDKGEKSENFVENENIEEGPQAVLPLVDVHSQNALRRKVFLNSLNKVLQNFAELLRFSMYNVQSDVQGLVKTFNLRADNVIFKPLAWNIIGIVILNILTIKNEYLKEIMESESSKYHVGQILKPFPDYQQFLSDIIFKFNNIENYLECYLSK